MFDECGAFRKRTCVKWLLCLVLVCGLILCGCKMPEEPPVETTRETWIETQPEETVPETQVPAVCVVGVTCALKIYDADGQPRQGVKVMVETPDGQTMFIAQFSDTYPEHILSLPEGDYRMTLIDLEATPISRFEYPLEARLGQADSLRVYTDETGALIPECPEIREAPSDVEKVRLGEEGPLAYEELIWDRSDRTLNEKNHHNAIVQLYYVAFSGSEAAREINTELYRVAEGFMTAYTEEQIREPHYAYGMAFHYSHKGYMDITHNGDGLLSIHFYYMSFWGEDQEFSGEKGYVFDLATGQKLTLSQLLGIGEEALWQQEKSIVEQYLRNTLTPQEAREKVDAMMPEDVGFIVSDGAVYLLLEIPDPFVRNGIPRPIHTQWRIN